MEVSLALFSLVWCLIESFESGPSRLRRICKMVVTGSSLREKSEREVLSE